MKNCNVMGQEIKSYNNICLNRRLLEEKGRNIKLASLNRVKTRYVITSGLSVDTQTDDVYEFAYRQRDRI